MARCDECGYDWEVEPEQLVEQLRVFPERYRTPLTRFLVGEDPDTVVRTRPAPRVWSALEYAAHTREALDFYAGRVERALAEDRPQLTPFDLDAACADRRYNAQDVARVVEELRRSADRLATRLAPLDGNGWQKPAVTSDGGETTVVLLARRAVHEGHHHLLDIGRVLRRVRGRA
jgi:DinB superfamily